MTFQIVEAEQRSEAWYAARVGKLTGSVAGEMLARTKTGWSTSRRNLLLRLVLERLTGKSMERNFTTQAIEAGIEREPLAVAAFEALTGQLVQTTGFLQHATLPAGCSLDGHLGEFETLLSIKCRQPNAHLEFLRTGKIPHDALTQMRHELWLTGASRHTYFSFNPDFPEPLQSRLVTLSATDLDPAGYDLDVRAFLAEVDAELDAVRSMTEAAC
jgi:hypothetical protein